MEENEKKEYIQNMKSKKFQEEVKRDARRYHNLFGTFEGYSI
jgi:hypothetical protein